MANAQHIWKERKITRTKQSMKVNSDAGQQSMAKSATKVVHILLGGGIDSSALIPFYLSLGLNAVGIHFNYGQPSAAGERRAVKLIAKHYRIRARMVDLGFRLHIQRGEVRCRNALLLLSAAGLNEHPKMLISMGIHAGTHYYDCSYRFIDNIQVLLDGYFGGSVRFDAPFARFTKTGVYQYCERAKVPLELTFSCERRSDAPCGRCRSYKDRQRLHEQH